MTVLTPTQLAQLTLSSGALNDTHQIDLVFDRLTEGNSLENVDKFYTELTAGGMVGCSSTLRTDNASFDQLYPVLKAGLKMFSYVTI